METENKPKGTNDFLNDLGLGGSDTQVQEPEAEKEEVQTETPKEEIQEEQTEDTSATEEPNEQATQDDGEEGQPEPEAQPQTSFDLIKEFNDKFGTEYKDEESIKAILEASQQNEELQEKLKKLESLEEENLLLKDSLDPMKYFGSEDEFKVAMFKKQFPDKDPAAVATLFSKDLSAMGDADVLAYKLLMDTPDLDGGLEGAKELIQEEYGIEEGEEMSRALKNKLKVNANQARGNVTSMKKEIQLPDKVDVDSLAAQQKELRAKKQEALKNDWSQVAEKVKSSFEDIVVKDNVDGEEQEIFRYTAGKDFPSEVMQTVVENMARQGVDVTEESVGAVYQAMKKEFIASNHDKMIKAARADALAKAEEKRLKEQHNPGTPKQNVPPKKDGAKDVNQQILADLKSSGWNPARL